MKIIGILLLVLSGWAIGYKKSSELFLRVRRLELLHGCLQELLARMVYEGAGREELIETLLVSNGFLQKSGSNFSVCDNHLSMEDRELILQYIQTFGNADLKTEEKRLKLLMERLKKQMDTAHKKAEENGKLYRTVGLCGGVMMGIFLL